MTGPKRVVQKKPAARRASGGKRASALPAPAHLQAKLSGAGTPLACGRLAQAVVPSPLEGHESPHDFDELLAVLHDDFATWSAIERLLARLSRARQ